MAGRGRALGRPAAHGGLIVPSRCPAPPAGTRVGTGAFSAEADAGSAREGALQQRFRAGPDRDAIGPGSKGMNRAY